MIMKDENRKNEECEFFLDDSISVYVWGLSVRKNHVVVFFIVEQSKKNWYKQ